MKAKQRTPRALLLISFGLLFQTIAFSQRNGCHDYHMNFEENSNYCLDQLFIDTINYPNNKWQIGKPQKPTLNHAYESKNAIVTDTLNPYPTNDTSVFIVSNSAIGGGFVWPLVAALHGYYWVESDSLNDFGTIEFSPDNGNTWIDLIADTVFDLYWYSDKPTLTGNSGGWKGFDVDLTPIAFAFDIDYQDTLQFRFSFFTDSIHDSLGGLMFDNFYFEDWVEGIEESELYDKIKLYPNPANNSLVINTLINDYRIIDVFGNLVLSGSGLNSNSYKINTSTLRNGTYLLSISDPISQYEYHKPFIVIH